MIKIPQKEYEEIKETLSKHGILINWEHRPEKITCLICGKECTSVGSHCKKHGLTAKEYLDEETTNSEYITFEQDIGYEYLDKSDEDWQEYIVKIKEIHAIFQKSVRKSCSTILLLVFSFTFSRYILFKRMYS